MYRQGVEAEPIRVTFLCGKASQTRFSLWSKLKEKQRCSSGAGGGLPPFELLWPCADI
jgi:hypothetical protein